MARNIDFRVYKRCLLCKPTGNGHFGRFLAFGAGQGLYDSFDRHGLPSFPFIPGHQRPTCLDPYPLQFVPLAAPHSHQSSNFTVAAIFTVMAPTPSYTRAWFALLSIALVLRLLAGVWWQSRLPADQRFHFGDSEGYWMLGRAIARGEPYAYPTPEYNVFRTPGYPLMLAALFKLWGDDPPVLAARALSALLGVAAVGVAGWWATSLFDARTGLWAGAIVALYPGAIAMGAFVLSEAPFCPFMLLQLGLWGKAWRSPRRKQSLALACASGIAAGLGTLVRPSWLLFTPFALVLGLLLERQRARQLALGGMVCAGLAISMLPWWIRNAQVTGHLVTTTLHVGASLYDGLGPQADGASTMGFVRAFEAEERLVRGSAAAEETFEYRLDRRMARASLQWAWEHPGRVVQLAGIKFVRIWNIWPNEASFRNWPMRLIVVLSYTPLLVLALMGAWRYSASGWPYVLAWLPAVYFTLLHMVFIGSIRYREPAMIALAVLAAAVLSRAPPRPIAAHLPAS